MSSWSSNIAQNHSSSTKEVTSDHHLLQFTWKVDQKWNYVKLEVGSNISQNHLSSLIEICPELLV